MTFSCVERAARRRVAALVSLVVLCAASGRASWAVADTAQAPGAGAARSAALESAWPEELSQRLASALAAEWGLSASRLHVHWVPAEGVMAPAPGTPLHIAGRGRDGWIVAVLDEPNRAALAVRARIAVDESVSVATHELAPGISLAVGDLKRDLRQRWGPPAADPPPSPAAGWVTRRALAAGETVAWPAALPPAAVRDGDNVEVRWERGGVRVSTHATALQAAAEGERIRVRLADGSVNRDALVIGAGVVAIQPGERR